MEFLLAALMNSSSFLSIALGYRAHSCFRNDSWVANSPQSSSMSGSCYSLLDFEAPKLCADAKIGTGRRGGTHLSAQTVSLLLGLDLCYSSSQSQMG
jgi:hypothetical protein